MSDKNISDIVTVSQDLTDQTTESPAQLEKLARENLLGFFVSHVDELKRPSPLETTVESILLERIVNNPEGISTMALVKIMEVMNKSRVQRESNLVSLIQRQIPIKFEGDSPIPPGGTSIPTQEGNSQLTREEYRRLIEIWEKLQDSSNTNESE